MSAQFPRFVSAGEALTDMLRTGADQWSSQVGGSTWNVARVMARLGVPSAFAGAVSRDVFGDALAQATEVAGLDMRFLQRYAKSPLLAIVHELHPPTYYFIGDDSADLHFDAAQLPPTWRRCRRNSLNHLAPKTIPLLHGDGGIDAAAAIVRREPAGRDGLGLGPEVQRLFAVRAQVAQF